MRVIVNAKYKHLESFIRSLPDKFEEIGTSIYKERNEIKLIDFEGIKLNVKSFKVPHLINKIAYAWLRGSKAKHSFEYAMRLNRLGVNTPEAVACVEVLKNGLFSRSFYVCLHHEYDYTIREISQLTISEKKELLQGFTQFTFDKLHSNGVLHPDYSPGNILISNKKPGYEFSIVDVNRIRFKTVGYKDGLRNLSYLWLEDNEMDMVAREYARINKKDEDEASLALIKMNQNHKIKVERKYAFKEKLKRKKMKL